jgi:hypothetical protein
MQTRDQELTALDGRIAALKDRIEQERDTRKRDTMQRQAAAADTEGRRLINERHDRLDAERQRQEQATADAIAVVSAQQEAQIRSQLRRRWLGDEASFAAAWPRLLEEYRVDTALGRAPADDGLRPRFEF